MGWGIHSLALFGKNEKDNLTTADRKAIAAIIQAYRIEREREFRRGREQEGGV